MSHPLISHNDDLRRLRDDGYDVDVIDGHLVVRGVPYVNSSRQIMDGTLAARALSLAGDKTLQPGDHVARFAGECPCDRDGRPLQKILAGNEEVQIAPGIKTCWLFSSKPPEGYRDYHHMMTSYARILEDQAKAIDESVTAQRYLPYESAPDESVFCYIDTHSSRAGLDAVNTKLEGERVGIVGVGGAGSYLLDLLAKTGVREIHLFDGDHLETHNAFRAPGAISLDELRAQPSKARFWAQKYSPMRRAIIVHDSHVTEKNVNELGDLSFVFLCLDSGSSKRLIVQKLEEMNKPFIDVGIGLGKNDNESIFGQVRTTASFPNMREHFASRVDYSDEGNDVYRTNIQIAELNALNAVLAVIKWKKLCGFYADVEEEFGSVYMVEGNVLANEP